jgi:hypothetical protein
LNCTQSLTQNDCDSNYFDVSQALKVLFAIWLNFIKLIKNKFKFINDIIDCKSSQVVEH